MASVLYLAPVDWHSIRQRPQHLALRLARKYELTYVDPVGLRSARLSDFRRLFATAAGRASDSPAFPVVNPRYVPLVGWQALDRWNRRWLSRQMERCLADGPEILWIGSPSLLAEAILERTRPRLVVYDCMDRYAAFHRGATRERIERSERAIVARADLIFATSRGLVERMQAIGPPVELAPNGVDFARFAAAQPGEPPAWRRKIAGPVVGYHGALGDWLDFEMLSWLAKRRRDWSFVVIGPNGSRRSRAFLSQPNVEYLGPIPYAELADHTAWFDVGLAPFEHNELTQCVHPIKVLEYLATGLPTVSTYLPDLANLAGVIRFADTPSEWLAAIEDALEPAARTQEKLAARRNAVAGLGWDRLGETIAARLDAALAAADLDRRDSLAGPPATRAA